MTSTTPHRSPARLAAGSALLALMLSGVPALAEGAADAPPPQPFEITPKILADSITQYDAPSSITSLGSAAADGEVIVLEADILFASNAWELPSTGADRIAELAEQIPDGATVQVGGHTDSRPVDMTRYDADNQQLSENRAQAVADALASRRPDLQLEVTGYGSTQPAVTENPEDPGSYAANRRVELRYGEG